jgi:hypothetical protein
MHLTFKRLDAPGSGEVNLGGRFVVGGRGHPYVDGGRRCGMWNSQKVDLEGDKICIVKKKKKKKKKRLKKILKKKKKKKKNN